MPRRHTPPPSWDRLDDDDPELLRQAVGPVRPLRQGADTVLRGPPRPPPRPRQLEADERWALHASRNPDPATIEPGDASAYRQARLPLRAMRRLRRGLYAVQDEIDLHHLDLQQATRMLRDFLREAVHRRLRCVRIVHGKGLHSATGRPTLRPEVERQLRLRRDVLAYCSAPAAQGGTGALLVLLDPADR